MDHRGIAGGVEIKQLTHIDLFTGIGGFVLACEWAGIKTEVFCEYDKRCQEFLQRTYPGVPLVSDVREFDGTRWRGRFLLTGGVPCQPASRAGKQRGKDDVRWLWLEAIRVIGEAKPSWCLLENPPGIGDVGLKGILNDMESQGYEVRVFGIPACAVGSPQLRNRYWLVANATESNSPRNGKISNDVFREPSQSDVADSSIERRQQESGGTSQDESEYAGRPTASDNKPSSNVQSDVADSLRSGRGTDTEGTGQGGRTFDRGTCEEIGLANTHEMRWRGRTGEPRPAGWEESKDRNFWSNSVWLPCADGKVRRVPDDSFGVAHGLHRSVLAGLGNSIVPQVAYEIIRAIKEVEEGLRVNGKHVA